MLGIPSFEDPNAELVDTAYLNPEFNSQYTGAAKVGLFHGAIHSAVPNIVSTGTAQATHFLANGGWYRFTGSFCTQLCLVR